MYTSTERNIGACLLKSGAHHEQEYVAADGRSCGRHQFDEMAPQRQRLGELAKRPRCGARTE